MHSRNNKATLCNSVFLYAAVLLWSIDKAHNQQMHRGHLTPTNATGLVQYAKQQLGWKIYYRHPAFKCTQCAHTHSLHLCELPLGSLSDMHLIVRLGLM